jgi:hypothetical protein
MADKPKLNLLKAGKTLTVEQLAALYEKLTGKKPTEQELEAARQRLAEKQ